MEAMPDVPDVTAADDVLEAVVAVEVSASDMLDVTGIDESVVDSDVVGSELLWHVLDDY